MTISLTGQHRDRFIAELRAHRGELRRLAAIAKRRTVTLLFAAHDVERNNKLRAELAAAEEQVAQAACVMRAHVAELLPGWMRELPPRSPWVEQRER